MAVTAAFFAVLELRWSAATRRQLYQAQPSREIREAFEESMAARGAFVQAVARCRSVEQTSDLLAIQAAADVRRGALKRLERAQNEWSSIRAEHSADDGSWFGHGVVTAWALGFVAFERAFIRLDHSTDEAAWVIFEVRRRRFGLGLGWEQQRVAASATHADLAHLDLLVASAFDDADVAFRPGFVPLRVLRLLRRPAPQRRAIDELLAVGTAADMAAGARFAIDAAARQHDVLPAVRTDRAALDLHLSGPSVLIGAWLRAAAKVDVLVSWPERPSSDRSSRVVALDGAAVGEPALR